MIKLYLILNLASRKIAYVILKLFYLRINKIVACI